MWNIYIWIYLDDLTFFYNFNHRVVLGLTIVIGGYGLFDNWRTSTKMKLRTSGPCGGNISLLSIEFRLNIWVLGQEVKDQPEKSRAVGFLMLFRHMAGEVTINKLWFPRWNPHDFPGEIRMLNQIIEASPSMRRANFWLVNFYNSARYMFTWVPVTHQNG